MTAAYVACTAGLPYRAAVAISFSWRIRMIGLCTLYLPTKVVVLTESGFVFG